MSYVVKGKRYRDDEVPESDGWMPYDEFLDAIRGLCSYCGQKGHTKPRCPNRPVTGDPGPSWR